MPGSLPALFDWPPEPVLARAARIRILALDVDGVLTDGTVWYGPAGETLKPFSILDGLGLRLLLRAGIHVAIITARSSEPLHARMHDLGLEMVYSGVDDKLQTWERVLQELALEPGAAAYMGDDLIDLPVLRRAGLALTVPNGHPALRCAAHWCSRRSGGQGAVREACELILAGHGRLADVLAEYGHE